MYPEFARVAEEEDLKHISIRLMAIANAEKHHEERYAKLLKEVEGKTVFDKEEEEFTLGKKRSYPNVVKLQVPKITMSDISNEFHARKR